MLELRPGCECCDRDLPPESLDARICSFECTFCESCATNKLQDRCPNCGGDGKARHIWGNQTPTGQNKLGPSPDRWAQRSLTYPGIAEAMADQWGVQ